MEYYIIYETTNKINSMIYRGAHRTSDLTDGYLGSGKYLKNAINKYGTENFSREILFTAISSDVMYWVESWFVDEEFVQSEKTYNLKVGGYGGFDYINSNNLNYAHGVDDNWKIGRDKQHWLRENDNNWKENELNNLRNMSLKAQTEDSRVKRKASFNNIQHQQGQKNSQFGTIWIYNLELKVNKKIKKKDLLTWEQEGWLKGRKIK